MFGEVTGEPLAVAPAASPTSSLQPKDFAFTAENLRMGASGQIAKYPEGRQASAVIPLLWRAQEQVGGWVPEAAIRYVADLLGMAHIRVLEVATFYTMFNLAPVGRWHVQLCGTTPCMLRGAEDLKEICHDRIGEQMHPTADGTFSWVEVECLGACVNAPMVQINYDFYEDLTPESFNRILDELAAGRTPEPGPQVDRQLSAPVGGPTTLTDPALYATNGGSRAAAQQPLDRRRCQDAGRGRERARSRRSQSPGRRRVEGPDHHQAGMMLADKDRIFKNLYGLHDWGLEARARAAPGTTPRRSSTRAATPSSTRSRRRACAGAAAPASRPA